MPAGKLKVPFKLYLITDRRLAEKRGGLSVVVEAALSAASTTTDGARAVAVQLREKDLSARDLYELARALREISTRYGSSLLVNDRVDVVIAAQADGVHLSGTSIDVADARLALELAGRKVRRMSHRERQIDRKSTRLNSSHRSVSRMPSSA